jgi:glycosyltransferase involved in cell wall biosynthesis
MGAPTILHVIPGLPTGGAERMLASLVTAQRADAMTPVVVDMIGGGELAAPIRAAGIPVHDLGLKRPLDMPAALLRLTRLIRHVAPTAIQSWLYYADLLSLWALERSGRRGMTRLYWGVRCSDMDQRQYSRALRWTIAACAQRAARPDAVVANSFAGRDVHRRLGYSPRAFPVIPNGVDTGQFRPDPAMRARTRSELDIADNRTLVIHVARVDAMKDHDSLIAVAKALPDISFLAVGAGTEGLAGPPNFRGLGKRSDVSTLYAAADQLISTSAFGEGFSNVIAEAMASGLPVVATDVGDARRIVEGSGEVIPPRRPDAMIAAVARLAAEPVPQRQARSLAGRQRVETNFSLARAVSAFDALHLHGVLPGGGANLPGES